MDCTELFIEVPTSYRTQSATFSSYKHHNIAKGLVGIAPNGAVTLVSQLTSARGLHHGRPGFELDDDLPEGVSLNIPSFPNGKPQLSLQEENKKRQIASVGLHVERAIERTKNYKILQSVSLCPWIQI